ncbi:MAG: acyl-CoA thioesterase [Candidatus Latescibacteria bacterium]|nr:acyl-CoA thioesterase [Candidatus Latescibacterota bacterium]
MSGGKYCFELELGVRDYECDLQGVVNNAVYLNYLEHTRHEYLKSLGLDFAGLHQQGWDLVLTRCELDYRSPLRSGDRFVVRLRLERESRLRFAFLQEIYRLPDQRLVLQAKAIGTGLIQGRPALPPELQALLERGTV